MQNISYAHFLQNVNTDPDLHKEVSKMLFELRDVLIEAEESLDEDLNLKTVSKSNSTLPATENHTSQRKKSLTSCSWPSLIQAFVPSLTLLPNFILGLLVHSSRHNVNLLQHEA